MGAPRNRHTCSTELPPSASRWGPGEKSSVSFSKSAKESKDSNLCDLNGIHKAPGTGTASGPIGSQAFSYYHLALFCLFCFYFFFKLLFLFFHAVYVSLTVIKYLYRINERDAGDFRLPVWSKLPFPIITKRQLGESERT